ncbi:MAG: SCO family protein [Chitinophagales bacterium]|nr:SCO family protein [Chitinophagales bacterium]MDW8428581.1 SCO family protein [Chitinophagales bacterium]
MNRRWLLRISAFLIVIGLPLVFFLYWKHRLDQAPREADQIPVLWPMPEFRSPYSERDSLSNQDLRGSVVVIDFIFTNCGSICPQLSMTMRQIQESFRNDDRVVLVSFTIDPLRDTFPVLRQYAARYGAISGKWFFLRPDTSTLRFLTNEGFKVPVVHTPEAGYGYEFTHTNRLVLVDAMGQIRGFYDGLDKQSIDQLYDDIGRLLIQMRS